MSLSHCVNSEKNRRVPNPYMLFVKDHKEVVRNKTTTIGAFLGEKWHLLQPEEKQVYYDKYNVLRKLQDLNNSAMKTENQMKNSSVEETANNNSNVIVVDTQKRKLDEHFCDEKQEINKIVNGMKFKNATPTVKTVKFFVKQKAKKKQKRPPNPFMLFAKEHRNNVKATYVKDKKCHSSTVLGNMWRDLPSSEKTKYKEEARRLHKFDLGSSRVKVKRHKKRIHRPVGRPCKKPKESISESTSRVDQPLNVENISSNEETIEFSESQVSTSIPNVTYPQNSSLRSHNHYFQPSNDSHQARNCFCCNSVDHLHGDHRNDMRQFPIPDGTMSKPCGAAAFPPPFFMPYNSHFWMYQQMFQQMYFQSFSQPYCCGSPYNYYRNAYFNPYYPGRNGGSFYNSPQPYSSTDVDNFVSRDAAVDAAAPNQISEEEFIDVDDHSGQRSDNGTNPSDPSIN